MADIGPRIKAVRRYRGDLSQEDFGDSIGMTKGGVSLIENGKREASTQMLSTICHEFDIDVRFFFGQLDTIEDADLRLHPPINLTDIAKKLEIVEKKLAPAEHVDEIAASWLGRPTIREIVRRLSVLNDETLRRAGDVLYGFVARGEDVERERASERKRA